MDTDFRMPLEVHPEQEGVPEGYTRYRLHNNGSPGTFAGSHSSHYVLGHDVCGNMVTDIDVHEKFCPAKLERRRLARESVVRRAALRGRLPKRELPPA